MTYNKTKNATIVFAFAAVLLAWPMAAQNAFAVETIDANMNPECGFSTTNLGSLDFGNFVPTDSESGNALEQEITLTGNGASSARVFITVEDWKTIGTRASGTIELTNPEAGVDTVTIGGETYTADATTTGANTFDVSGNAVSDAFELSESIRATDATNFKASTGGSSIVTINTVARGTAVNGGTLTENTGNGDIVTKDSSGVDTAGDYDGAADTALTIMEGQTTKFDLNIGSTATSAYGAKVSVITVGTSQEVLGGTTEADIYLALEIDPASATFDNAALPYDGAITQDITIEVDAACDGTE